MERAFQGRFINSIARRLKPKYVFCYHRIIPEETARNEFVHRALYVTPETFERHVVWMLSIGRIVGVEDIIKDNDDLLFMITFDDGWSDNFDYAFPILKKYNVTATLFVSSDNIDKSKIFWSEEVCIKTGRSSLDIQEKVLILKRTINSILSGNRTVANLEYDNGNSGLSYLLDRLIECLKRIPIQDRTSVLMTLYEELDVVAYSENAPLLSWDEIRFMSNNGFTIGSHTHTHTILDRVEPHVIDYELSASKATLEERLGVGINSFSYPNGSFLNPYIEQSLRKHSYKYAFTLERAPVANANFFKIPRALVYEDIAGNMDLYYSKLLVRSFLLRNRNISKWMTDRTHR